MNDDMQFDQNGDFSCIKPSRTDTKDDVRAGPHAALQVGDGRREAQQPVGP
jgi:hypothetical protein